MRRSALIKTPDPPTLRGDGPMGGDGRAGFASSYGREPSGAEPSRAEPKRRRAGRTGAAAPPPSSDRAGVTARRSEGRGQITFAHVSSSLHERLVT